MKTFKYRAKKGPEEFVEGVLAAESQDDAVEQINSMGLLPVDLAEEGVEELKKARKKNEKQAPPPKNRHKKKISSRDLLMFYQQLASLVKAGVPILRALSVVALQFQNDEMKKVVLQIRDEVREGHNLSEVLVSNPRLFSAFDIAMIHAGESVGRIDEALFRIADYRDNEEVVRSKISSAIAYPAFVVCLGFASIVFMLSYVIPKFSLFFEDLGQELPLATRLLLSISDWCKTGWILIPILLLIGVVAIKRVTSNPSQKRILDRALLKIPKFGPLILKSEISRLNRALELLIGSGMQLVTAMKIGKAVLKNEALKQEFDACCTHVADGRGFSEALEQSTLFPSVMIHLANVGEESGKLNESLGQIANWYERDLESAIKVMTTLLEPIIISVVGLVLGAIIIAVLLPVFSINAMVQ